jgi:Fe-S cluster assembly protein SufD
MTALTPIRTKAETALIAQFEALRREFPAGSALTAREAAMTSFAAAGLPHRRIEAYHYTDLRNLLREVAPLAGATGAAATGQSMKAGRFMGELGAYKLVIINGRLVEVDAAALPEGITISVFDGTAPTILDGGDPIVALNTAFARQTITVKIDKDLSVERPLHLVCVQDAAGPQAVFTRLRIEVGEGASLTLLETHEGPGSVVTQANTGVEIVVGDDAHLEHARVDAQASLALSLSSLGLSLGRRSRVVSLNLAAGSGMARHQIRAVFVGEQARLMLAGVGMLDGGMHSDTTLLVDHAVPGGESRELFKTVVEDRATGIFQGKIIVRPHAQKTDGKMMSAALLLSEEASMNNKPELEIFADDVQCGHGATCGALDGDLLFYLMARGIPRKEAQALLIRSFLGAPVETLSHEPLREAIGVLIDDWLKRRG